MRGNVMNICTRWASIALNGILFAWAGGAAAGGFGIAPQSGSGTGNAFAGGAAAVEDASIVWFNPAGMAFLPQGKQISVGLTAIKTSHKFQDEGSTGAFHLPGAGDGGNGGGWGYIPNGYFTMDLNPKWSFGLGVNAPFGLKTNYDAGWQGQLVALKSKVESININPSFAYKASDTVSVGAGVSAQKLKAELTKAAGTLGIASLNADDWGYGFNLGLMVQATPTTRFGASYRSSIKYELEGTATFSTGSVFNGNIEADLRVPDSASLSVFHEAGSKWELMGDVTWTKWSTFQQLLVLRTSGTPIPGREPPLTNEQYQWDDTWRFGLGANYKLNSQTKLRLGAAYDQTPTNDMTRTPRLPGENRRWVAFGVQYKPSRSGTLEVGYAHEFISDASVNNTVTGVPGALMGTFENKADIFSLQYSHLF